MRTLGRDVTGRSRGTIAGRGRWCAAVVLVALVAAAPMASFAAGAVTDKNVVEKLTTAKTAADYTALAAYFRAKAADAGAKVKQHEAMLKAVSGKPLASWGPHCQGFIESYSNMQKDYEASAAEMEAAAKNAPK